MQRIKYKAEDFMFYIFYTNIDKTDILNKCPKCAILSVILSAQKMPFPHFLDKGFCKIYEAWWGDVCRYWWGLSHLEKLFLFQFSKSSIYSDLKVRKDKVMVSFKDYGVSAIFLANRLNFCSCCSPCLHFCSRYAFKYTVITGSGEGC